MRQPDALARGRALLAGGGRSSPVSLRFNLAERCLRRGKRTSPDPIDAQTESVQYLGAVDSILICERCMVAAVFSEQEEERVLAYPVNNPVFGDLRRLVLI